MKVPFTLTSGGFDCPMRFSSLRSETHMGKKSLIIPCSADKREFKTVCAVRSGEMEIFHDESENNNESIGRPVRTLRL